LPNENGVLPLPVLLPKVMPLELNAPKPVLGDVAATGVAAAGLSLTAALPKAEVPNPLNAITLWLSLALLASNAPGLSLEILPKELAKLVEACAGTAKTPVDSILSC
jgi:hypothetical protein